MKWLIITNLNQPEPKMRFALLLANMLIGSCQKFQGPIYASFQHFPTSAPTCAMLSSKNSAAVVWGSGSSRTSR